MAKTATTKRLISTSTAGLMMGWAASAAALVPVERPWAPTPERFVRTVADHPAAAAHPSLEAAGLRVWSRRPDGAAAYAFRATEASAANLAPAAAGERALSLARALAPELGLDGADLSLASVHPLTGFTTVFVAQSHLGVPVARGFLAFGFTGAELTSVRNELYAPLDLSVAPKLDAAEAARVAMVAARGWAPAAKLEGAPALTIWAPGDDAAEARLVWDVAVSSASPRAALTMHVDAVQGVLLAVDDAVRHADGEGRVRMRVHPVNSDSTPESFTVVNLDVGSQTTDGDGELVAPGSETITYSGPWARIQDASGQQTERLTLSMSGPYQVYDLQPGNLTQADPFVHTNVVKQWAAGITPTLGWIDRRLSVNVNINETCNAFWDGQTINFFRAGGSCNNTGQISSIVYHEFGHGYHQNLTRNVVGSIGEGTGDFLAATVLDDPIVGRGFSTRGAGIRRIDGNNRFPDDYVGEVHEDGLIWATALWDLREAMIAKHGDWAGRIIVDRAFVRGVSRGPGLSTAYPSILEGDDDDGDITNGTPNSCEINAAFGAHGLIESGQINHDQVPGLAWARIEHDAPGRVRADDAGVVRLYATVSNASACGSVDAGALELWISRSGGPFEQVSLQISGATATAEIADLEPGATFAYRWQIDADGRTFELGSEGSPLVALVDPGLEDIHTESFEAGFGAWTHGPLQGDLHDDWEVASPLGRAYDPFEAKDGQAVVGTDLGDGGGFGGSDGAAKAGRATFLQSPPLSTEGMQGVHLELWQHYAVSGTLRVFVDGEVVHQYDGAGDTWSGGWRYLAIPLGETADDRADLVVRFEVSPGANNQLGGWALDGLTLSGTEIPPPPPPPEPEPEPEPETPAPTDPIDAPEAPAPEVPEDPVGFTRNSLGGGCTCAKPSDASGGLAASVLFGALVFARRRRRS